MSDWTHGTTCPTCGAEDIDLPNDGSGAGFRHVETPTGSVFLSDNDDILHTCGTLTFSDYALGVELLEQVR